MIKDELQVFNGKLNSTLDKHTENSYIIISSIYFEELKKDVKNSRFSFIPFFGGFIEDSENKEIIKSALFIPNYKIGSITPYKEDDTLKNLGVSLLNKYNQDSFIFKPSNEKNTPFYINKNGDTISLYENDINDLIRIYFTDLSKDNKYTFTENLFINKSPLDLNEAKKRYGELFFNLS